ncbi:TrmH family RNA methyltransferase [Leptolyngbya sp. PCC 6406]|uniref:TrmH family RNA methyltransferase n=1 Tax=Leptolyngbya sp. PCC 6406 TaxID=1173264 RepID=UPI0002ACF306|nr:RNA methyltransferase [Leptolyngbya sp. PCC 6406]
MLTSIQNPLVKQGRKLHQGKGRRSLQQFLLEGTHLLQEALAVGQPLVVVCATPDWQVRYPDLWQSAIAVSSRHETVAPEVLTALATTVNPDGVVAIAPHQDASPMPVIPHLGVAVETLQDPGNLGTLIRTAAAAHCDGLWVTGDSVDLEHPKVLRASAGQWFRLPLAICPDLPNQMHQWRQAGCQVLTTGSEGTVPYWAVDLCQATVLVLGNEGAGLSPAVQAAASTMITIPMAATVESLNVGVAAAVILFEAQRQRSAAMGA